MPRSDVAENNLHKLFTQSNLRIEMPCRAAEYSGTMSLYSALSQFVDTVSKCNRSAGTATLPPNGALRWLRALLRCGDGGSRRRIFHVGGTVRGAKRCRDGKPQSRGRRRAGAARSHYLHRLPPRARPAACGNRMPCRGASKVAYVGDAFCYPGALLHRRTDSALHGSDR